MDQQFFMPTRIIMGENSVLENYSVFAQMGKKALIVTGFSSAKKNGSLNDVTQALSKNNQTWSIYDKVMSNPTIECVYEGASFARAEKADFIIAIGGGSPMDAAKAISLLACQDIPREELFSGKYGTQILPMIFIPTTAGTGSEVTQASVLTDHEKQTKISISSPLMFPRIAILDAKYMKNLSRDITINTAVDALTHAVEGMLSRRANPITDAIASESISMISSCFEGLLSFNLSEKDRQNLLYASTLAGMVITNTGTAAVHSMGYSLTYYKNIDHGRANGLLIVEYLRFMEGHSAKIKQILTCMGMKNLDELKNILDKLLGKKEPITIEEINKFTEKAILAKNIKNSVPNPEKEDVFNIYKLSLS
ncbi:MAG: iron-containing alcohol dehydrogenase [Clostridiaceae bacterium]|nr:iron-containing alcohol dehydrogenase [Clostridiaceae bacterium]